MWFTEIVLFILNLLIFKSLWNYLKYICKVNKIPKSPTDVSIKSLWKIATSDTKYCFEVYTSGILSCKLTRTWLVKFTNINIILPEDVKIILNSKHCLDKPDVLKNAANLHQGSLFGDLGPWKSHRKILNPYFGPLSLQESIPIFNRKVKVLMENLSEMKGKGEFNILYNIAALTLDNILAHMELDLDIQRQEKNNHYASMKSIEIHSETAMLRILKPWLASDIIFKMSSIGKKQKKAKDYISNNLVNKIIDRIRNDEGNNSKSFVRALMDPKHNLSDKEIHDEIYSIIVAAQDTTTLTVSSALLMLAMHENIQNKVVDELKQVIGTSTDDFYLDIEKLNELKYLEMVINETLRLIPTIPLVLKINYEDITSHEGYIIPANSILFISIFNIHRDKMNWGEDADEFKPERFEKENFEKIHPYAFVPFVKGPRMCLGWRYAMYSIKILLANVLLKYKIETNLRLNELKFKSNISLNIVQGYMVSLTDRNFATFDN